MKTTNIMSASCAILFTFMVFSEPVYLGSIVTWALLMLTIAAVWLAVRAWHYRKLNRLMNNKYGNRF